MLITGKSTTLRTILVAIYWLAFFSSHATAATPDTPAGRAFDAWLDIFNAGNTEAITAYYRDHFPEAYLQNANTHRANTGGYDVVEFRKSEPLQIEFVAQERATQKVFFGRLSVRDAATGVVERFRAHLVPQGAEIIGFEIRDDDKRHVIEGSIRHLNESYVFPEIAEKMTTDLQNKLSSKAFAQIEDGPVFARVLTEALQSISRDKHLSVSFTPVRLPPEPSPQAGFSQEIRAIVEKMNCAFERIGHMPNEIGYLKLNEFISPELCNETAIAAMKFLGGVKALIVDLRDNGGGDPAMIAFLSSYFFERPTHLNDIWERKTGTTQQYWTHSDVEGKRLVTQPIFVLTSSRTFSAAEEFAFNLKTLKRAKIVGEVTGGGAHPTATHKLNDRFAISVPFGRAINPITNSNWEGSGVDPDVKVPSAEALEVAYKLAYTAVAN